MVDWASWVSLHPHLASARRVVSTKTTKKSIRMGFWKREKEKSEFGGEMKKKKKENTNFCCQELFGKGET